VPAGCFVCTPMRSIAGPEGPRIEQPTIEWHRARMALKFPTNWANVEIIRDGFPVDEARNTAVELAAPHALCPEFMLWIDNDVCVPEDAVLKLVYRARCFPQYDIFSGVYCTKVGPGRPSEPLIYKEHGTGACWDWTLGDLIFDATRVGMGLALVRMSLYKRLPHSRTRPWYKTTEHCTEDIWFCDRARREVGAKILVDTSVLAPHIDNRTGVQYGLPADSPPIQRARWLANKYQPWPEKLALQIGDAGNPRHWNGYQTQTVDGRPGGDQVMDCRWLNFPAGTFDLVGSVHQLERFDAGEQRRLWAEMVRVLKPGGRIEVTVNNLDWVAGLKMDGKEGRLLYGQLYGGRNGDARRFCYTPTVARAYANSAGLENVAVESYLNRAELGPDLVITGDAPRSVTLPVSVSEQEILSPPA
jgi:hypothetical protein